MDEVVNKKQKKIVSWIGMLLMAVSIVFIVQRFLEVELDYTVLASPWVVVGLIAVMIVSGLYVLVTAINYRCWLYNVSGDKLPLSVVLSAYCNANMYKYIPGGVLAVLGRNRLAIENKELSHGKVAIATVLEGAFFVIAALVLALVFSSDYAVTELRRIDNLPVILAVIFGILAIAAVAVYLARFRVRKFFENADGKSVLKPIVLVKRLGAALGFMTVWGTMFFVVLALMGQPVTLRIAFAVVGLFNLSWIIGFFVPVAPAGFGVREAAMLIFIGSIVNDGYLILAIMAHRLVQVTGDILAYCAALLYKKLSRNQQNLSASNRL
jgi:hypothetical protein